MKRVLVIWQCPERAVHRYARQSVLDMLDDGKPNQQGEVEFSGRARYDREGTEKTVCGTTSLPKSWILHIEEVDDKTPMYVEKRADPKWNRPKKEE